MMPSRGMGAINPSKQPGKKPRVVKKKVAPLKRTKPKADLPSKTAFKKSKRTARG